MMAVNCRCRSGSLFSVRDGGRERAVADDLVDVVGRAEIVHVFLADLARCAKVDALLRILHHLFADVGFGDGGVGENAVLGDAATGEEDPLPFFLAS